MSINTLFLLVIVTLLILVAAIAFIAARILLAPRRQEISNEVSAYQSDISPHDSSALGIDLVDAIAHEGDIHAVDFGGKGVSIQSGEAGGSIAAFVANREGKANDLQDDGDLLRQMNSEIKDSYAGGDIWNLAVINNNFGDTPNVRHPTENVLRVNVPPRRPMIVGRAAIVAQLCNRLLAQRPGILAIMGLPGSGKTTLALELIYQDAIAANFRDGILWASLGTQADIANLQADWAMALGIDLSTELDLDARSQRLDNALSRRNLLVVIDDVWQAQAARYFMCSGPQVRHIITTRSRDVAVELAGYDSVVMAPVLSVADGTELIRLLAPNAWMVDPVATESLVKEVGGLPMSVELLGKYLALTEQSLYPALNQHAFERLSDPVYRLQLAQERIGQRGKRTSIEATIQLSLDELEVVNPRSLAAFYALAAFAPKPHHFDRRAAEFVTEASGLDLAALVARNLLEMQSEDRWAVHQVLADAARIHLPEAARLRHASYYLQLVRDAPSDWMRIEEVYSQVRHAFYGLPQGHPWLVEYATTLETYVHRRGLWQDHLHLARLGLEIAVQMGDTKSEAKLALALGELLRLQGKIDEAHMRLEQAITAARVCQDYKIEAEALTEYGTEIVHHSTSEIQLSYLNQALELYRANGDVGGEAQVLATIGRAHAYAGDLKAAKSEMEEALRLASDQGSSVLLASIQAILATLYASQGEAKRAIELSEAALAEAQRLGHVSVEAFSHHSLGSAQAALGNHASAIANMSQACEIVRNAGLKPTEAGMLVGLGDEYMQQGELEAALDCFMRSAALYQTLKADEAAIVMQRIAFVYKSLKRPEDSVQVFLDLSNHYLSQGDSMREILMLQRAAGVRYEAGDVNSAMLLVEKSLELEEAAGLAADTVKTCATLYGFLSKAYPVQAQPYKSKAQQTAENLPDVGDRITSLLAAIANLTSFSLYKEALEFVDFTLDLRSRMPAKVKLKGFFTLASKIVEQLSDPSLRFAYSAKYWGDALDTDEHEAIAALGMLYGRSLTELGENDRALEVFQRALSSALYTEAADLASELSLQLGWLYWKLESNASAYSCFIDAIRYADNSQHALTSVKCRCEAISFLRSRRGLAEAHNLFAEAKELGAKVINSEERFTMLLAFAQLEMNLGINEVGLQNLQDAYLLASKIVVPHGRMSALIRVAWGLVEFDQAGRAREMVAEAEQATETIESKESLCLAALSLGEVLSRLKDIRARSWLTISLKLAEELDSVDMVVKVCEALANVCRQSEDNERAMLYLNRALSLASQTGNKQTAAKLQKKLAGLYSDAGKYELAEEELKRALQYYAGSRAIHDHALALRTLADVQTAAGRYQEARANYKAAAEQFDLLGDWMCRSRTLSDWAECEAINGRRQQAISMLENALKLCRSHSDWVREVTVLLKLAGIYRMARLWDQAESTYAQVISLARERKEAVPEAEALNRLGVTCLEMGKYEAALQWFHKALEAWEHQGELESQAAVMNNIGIALMCANRNQEATDNYLALYRLGKQHSDPTIQAEAMMLASKSSWALGKHDQATTYVNYALRHHQLGLSRREHVEMLRHLGRIAVSRKYYEEALSRFNLALRMVRDMEDRTAEAAILMQVAQVYLFQRKNDSALREFKRAASLMHNLGDLEGEFSAVSSVTYIYRRRREYKKAARTIWEWSEEVTNSVEYDVLLRLFWKQAGVRYSWKRRPSIHVHTTLQ